MGPATVAQQLTYDLGDRGFIPDQGTCLGCGLDHG